jgi:hypothetical protein
MLILLACTGPTDTDTAVEEGRVTLAVDEHVALPYTVAGSAVPTETFSLSIGSRSSTKDLRLTVEGDFAVDGDLGPLEANSTRTYTVRYTGDDAVPAIATGSATLSVEGSTVTVTLAAVVGDPALPDATWVSDGYGDEVTLALPSAPYPYQSEPYDDPSVFLFVPDGLSDHGALGVVTHLHGHSTNIGAVVPSMKLANQMALSGRDAVLIVPQGPVDAADGDFGRLDEPGGFADLVRDVVSVLYRDGYIARPTLGGITLTAHSGGYLATAAIVRDGGLPIGAVHLFDALYGESDTFADFAEAGGILRSAYTTGGGTDSENEALRAELERRGVVVAPDLSDASLASTTASISWVDATHAGCVTEERAWARWLAASGLPHNPLSPPELLGAVSDGEQVTVSWRYDAGEEDLRYRVEGSTDGSSFTLLTDTGESTAVVPNTPYIRVLTTDSRFGNSDPSDTYSAMGTDWLIVDGFDRVLDGSYDQPTHPFAAKLANAFGNASVASNEAVAAGLVSLSTFSRVVWMLGDESVHDRTFDAEEQVAIEDYVASGGTLVVTGSEVAYATDATWLDDTLHASLVSDDAGVVTVEGWTVGDAYTEDFPDVLDGDTTLWEWTSGGAAAVGYDNRVVVIGFGLENLPDGQLPAAVLSLDDYLE